MSDSLQHKPAKNILASYAFGVGLVLVNVAPVQALSFNWSFSNVIGGIEGTVSGTLEVPEGNDVAATSVILTSTTNPLFDSLIGVDFVTFPNFSNRFNVEEGEITASLFGTSFLSNTTNLGLEFNAEVFGDEDSQNLGFLTTAGNPLDGVCPDQCLQTAPFFGDNTGQTQFAPTFTPRSEASIPEASPAMGLLGVLGLMGIDRIRKTIRPKLSIKNN